MNFEEPIYLDREQLHLLMEDTIRHRLCWIYHDILSDPLIASLFDRDRIESDGPVPERWTPMIWVAAGRQEGSFYLLLKWYDDFYSPPEMGMLFYLRRDERAPAGVRVYNLRLDKDLQADWSSLAWWQDLWAEVSQNASDFFGPSTFDYSPIVWRLNALRRDPDHPFRAMDEYIDRKSDGEKAAECATVAAYFLSLQAVTDLVNAASHKQLADRDRTDILDLVDGATGSGRFPDLAALFQDLADTFRGAPLRAPRFERTGARLFQSGTDRGEIRWVGLRGERAMGLLREFYCRRDPDRVWEPFEKMQAELYLTQIRRPIGWEIPRGMYLLVRLRDRAGNTATDLFLVENVTGGQLHLCGGELSDLLSSVRENAFKTSQLFTGGRREKDPITGYAYQLMETYQLTLT